MRRLLLFLALLLFAAPVLAQGNCSDGTTGVIASTDYALSGDTLTVRFALEGDPSETLASLSTAVRFSGMEWVLNDPRPLIPPSSPYNEPPYATVVVFLPASGYENYFFPQIDGWPGPYASFSATPTPFLTPRFLLLGPLAEAAVEILDVGATQGDGSPASVCPPEDQGGFGTYVAAEPGAPASASVLHAPRPNPAQGTTTIPFEVAAPTPVRLTVHDALGREVARLVDGPVAAGPHEVPLAAGALPAGVYLVRMETPEGVRVQRLALVR